MRRLLLVDSDRRTLEALRHSLEPSYDVIAAGSREAACRALRQHSVHLVILEAQFPDGSGLGLLAHIRRRHPGLPTIIVTGYGSETICASAFKLGVRDYLTKPFDPGALRES